MPKHDWWEGIWTIKHVRKGKVIWEETKRNALVDEGESIMLDSFFRSLNAPTEFYVRLAFDSIQETDGLANIQREPVGNGYSAQLLERSTVGFPTLELHEGDYRVKSKEVTFAAIGGSIGPVNVAYLATTSDNTGKLVGYVALSIERTILDGDEVYVAMTIKMR